MIIYNYDLKKDNKIIELIDTRPLWRNTWQATVISFFFSHANITSSAASSSTETDLKGILSHGLCFSVEMRVIFPLKMGDVRIIFPVNLLKRHTQR